MQQSILTLIGGLSLFIFSVNKLSTLFREIFKETASKGIHKFTANIFASILTGIVLTVLLGSSSAVIILTIVLVNANVFSFKEVIGLVMGSNIGTTFSSQLFALNVAKYAPIPMLVGLLMYISIKNKKAKNIGEAILYLGMLFFGLNLIEHTMSAYSSNGQLINLLKTLENPWMGALAGGFVTLVIQSSSATIGILISLSKTSIITTKSSIAAMLGAELGTCSDTLIATINGSRQAVKTGIFHLIFNLVTIFLGLVFFNQFFEFIQWVSVTHLPQKIIANAHMWFNILGVLLFLPFAGLFERLLNYLLPDKDNQQ